MLGLAALIPGGRDNWMGELRENNTTGVPKLPMYMIRNFQMGGTFANKSKDSMAS